jgi:hypothetical protein
MSISVSETMYLVFIDSEQDGVRVCCLSEEGKQLVRSDDFSNSIYWTDWSSVMSLDDLSKVIELALKNNGSDSGGTG